ncbi:MAG: NAD(+) synthase [bacterium]|nr:NAD(+) synthase [bacterium]
MRNILPAIDPSLEKEKIISFLKKTFQEQKINRAVIGLSGGIDSTLSFYLLKEALPVGSIFAFHLPYYDSHSKNIDLILSKTCLPKKNFQTISVRLIVDSIKNALHLVSNDEHDQKIRIGNSMARARMIVLFDQAKKYNALVCGTENKSEHFLGYYTRFGDEASDIEPIRHLYKTQIYELAKYLNVPQEIIKTQPTAGLWEGQTDERQFGFTYEEADQVLYLYYDKNLSLKELKKYGFKNGEKIISLAKANEYKHEVPYTI